ncbi:phenylalanine--tRNA ligase, mitochondrial-like [Sycon ciliatum]|uniref:phenylalanine--tRNA ligase, mitochondrial-like n=1 Tax=Sycon ciliatum TaxID=27933 RepID=UPI0020A9FBE4|eukprot:scpid59353/ scgid6647/ Phenylalanine--tRNA ligase, mitochondrial; Phenylalanyl-tRNA synthetase
MYLASTITRSCLRLSSRTSTLWNRPASSSAGGGTLTDTHVEINGKQYAVDGITNATQPLLDKLGQRLHHNPIHPLHLIKRRIHEYFEKTYRKPNPSSAPLFTCLDDVHPVVTVQQNFDELLVPADHPARAKGDNYYLNKDYLLRAHTSAHQAEFLRSGLDAFLVTGDVYRRDCVDRTHYPCFHQMEGVRLYTSAELFPNEVHPPSLFVEGSEDTAERQSTHNPATTEVLEKELKSTLEGLVRHLFGADIKTEWAGEYFPFTHPSWELNIYFQDQWLEVLGCGIMRQQILDQAGASSKVGWAFGVGLERLAMILYGIPDIRFFWTTYHRFLDQFEPARNDINAQIQFTPFSKFAVCHKDVSFWTTAGKDFAGENDLMEIAREEAGDLIEWIEKVDYFENPKAKPGDAKFSSYCYRLNFRSHERQLLNTEINDIQLRIRAKVADKLGVILR